MTDDRIAELTQELANVRTLAAEQGERIAQYRDAIVPALESNADGWARRADVAERELANVRDTLARRSEALNRTGADNDRLRATIARVEKFPGLWLAETSDGQGRQLDHWRGPDYVDGRDVAFEMCAEALRIALATQETQ